MDEVRAEVVEFLGALSNSRLLDDDDAVDSLLRVLNDLTAPWAAKPMSAPCGVVEALDPGVSEWRSAGVAVADIPLWVALGFTHVSAREWIGNELGLHEVVLWSALGRVGNLDPAIVAGWEHQLRKGQLRGKVQRRDVFSWVQFGVPADPGARWWLSGWDWHDPQTAKEWVAAFGSSDDPGALLVNMSSGRSVAEVRPWFERGVVGADLEAFDRKGYTPERAALALATNSHIGDFECLHVDADVYHPHITGDDWGVVCGEAEVNGWRLAKFVDSETGSGVSDGCVVWFAKEGSRVEPRAVFKDGAFREGRVAVMYSSGVWTQVEFDLSLDEFLAVFRFSEGDDWWVRLYVGEGSNHGK